MTNHPRQRFRVVLILALGLLGFGVTAQGATGVVEAQSQTITSRLTAYAHVVPITIAKLHAAETGVIQSFNVEPGQHVTAGHSLGQLGGPPIKRLLAQRRSAVARAKAAVTASRDVLHIKQQQQKSHLSTRQGVHKAQSTLTQARARLSAARAALQSAQHNTVLRAPASGTIMARAATNGERVSQGQTLLTLQPDDGLWVKAVYYGSDSGKLHIGMAGRFIPADGAPPIKVTIARIMPGVQTGGGLPVGLRAQKQGVNWHSGEAGRVVLHGGHETGVMVPTRALILYQGHWWVLVKTAKGTKRQRVTRGRSRGDDTLIAHGLSADTPVVVYHAYGTFHRHFSQHYQKPG